MAALLRFTLDHLYCCQASQPSLQMLLPMGLFGGLALQAFANATMHPSDTPTIRWQGSRVHLHVFIPLLLIISVVSIFRYQHMLRTEVAAASERSKAEATRIGEALLEALQRIPTGQKEQAQQLLQDSMAYFAPQLKSVHWQMPGQTALLAQRPPAVSQAPVWFTRWTNLHSQEQELKQELPDGHVATLTVSLQASVFTDDIWKHLRQQIRFSMFNILSVVALLGLLVSRHVRLVEGCLRALRQLQRGQSQVRMMVTGIPSERAVARQFNLAADKLQSQWEGLQSALQRQSEQLELARLLATSTPRPVTLRKDDGTCIDVQREWHRLFGEDLATLEGNATQNVVLPAQHAGTATPYPDTQPTDDLATAMSSTIAHLVTASDWHRTQEVSRRASKAGTSVPVVPGGDGVITTDLHGHIETINEAAQFMTGFKTHQAMGRPLEEIFRLAHPPVPTDPSEEQPGSGNVQAAHPVLVHRSGERYAISYTASPIRKSNGVAVGCVLVFHDVSENSHFRQTISWQAHHDALTGLHNRAALAEHLTHGIFNAQRHQTLLAVCMVDLDHFEDINTTHGTATGDRVLREVALRLRAMTAPHDAVARMGGDEFVVMLGQQTDIAAIQAQTHELLAQLAQPYAVDELQLNMTASIGVALYPHVDTTPTALLRHADQAMCVAKRAGRQQVHFFDPFSDAATPTPHTQQTRIAQALRTGEMCLHYQPQVRLDTSEVCGVEALLRWQHPELGILGPEQVLPLIEDADLVAELGEWVLREALAQMQQWHARGLGWTVGVNIATPHLLRSNFAARLHDLLTLFAAPPQLLQLEVKQSAGQHNPQVVHDVMKDCRDRLGIRWAVDDIGIGQATLAWVTQLPIDTIKIDRSIVKAVLHSPEDAAIVSTMVTLAQSLQWTLVAEGVESVPHCQTLRQLGCNVAQGYAIAHPMPGRELPDWARSYQRSLSAESVSR